MSAFLKRGSDSIFSGISGKVELKTKPGALDKFIGHLTTAVKAENPTCDLVAAEPSEPDEWTELVDCQFGEAPETDGGFSVTWSCMNAWKWYYNERSGGCIGDPVVAFGVDFGGDE